MPTYLAQRGDFWIFKRRIPRKFAEIDSRGWVKQSTRIRISEDRAAIRALAVAQQINDDLEAFWRGLIRGETALAQRQYDDARKRARTLGFSYLPAAELAQSALSDILARLDKLAATGGVANARDVAALLGGKEAPPVMLSALLETYEAMVRADVRDMSPDQLRKWRTHKKRAIANLISVIGDKSLTTLTRNDALDFREWWQRRVLAEGLDNRTANKDFSRLSAMLRVVDTQRRLNIHPVFAKLSLASGEENRREAFEPKFIQERILKTGALGELNDEARRVVYIMTETGMRPSEIVNLTAETIMLDAIVPHVAIRADGRRTKTNESRREIPLVGVALAAAKAQPEGFPRYRDKSAGLSGAINKFLAENSLRPTERHTLYSLRHSFEDRLIAVETPEKVVASMMGHAYSRPRYGKGPSLVQKQKWLEKIAFRVPKSV
jgi:integrase